MSSFSNNAKKRDLTKTYSVLIRGRLSWAESVKKSFTGEGGRYTLAEKRRIDKALKLYLKAAEAAGNRDLVKRILALREEDEDNSAENEHLSTLSAKNQQKEPLTNINQGNMHVSDGEVRYSKKNALDNYQKRIEAWDGKTEGFSFVLGESPEYLSEITINGKKIGKKQVRIDATKVKKIMKDHPEMTIDVIKQLPELLYDPILVFDSNTVKDRLVLLGEVYAGGKPVMMALEINPSTRSGKSTYIDVIKVASAYTRSNTQSLINHSNLRYANENKNRVNDWLKVNRLQLPLPNSQSDSANNSITDSTEKVNSETKFSLKNTQLDALKKRGVDGDRLLDAIDLADDILAVNGEITEDAKAVLYHATSEENAKKINATGKMYGKEDNLFLSFQPSASLDGRVAKKR